MQIAAPRVNKSIVLIESAAASLPVAPALCRQPCVWNVSDWWTGGGCRSTVFLSNVLHIFKAMPQLWVSYREFNSPRTQSKPNTPSKNTDERRSVYRCPYCPSTAIPKWRRHGMATCLEFKIKQPYIEEALIGWCEWFSVSVSDWPTEKKKRGTCLFTKSRKHGESWSSSSSSAGRPWGVVVSRPRQRWPQNRKYHIMPATIYY